MSISRGGLHLENASANLQNGHVEGTTTEIKDQHVSVVGAFFVQAVCNSSCSWLVYDSLDIQASDGTRVLCSLSL